jgi:hypothetical protein
VRAGRSLRDLAPAIFLFALAALVVAGLPWRCPMLALTGLPCPTCGLTRATRLALRGDLAGATRMHPLWFVVVPACTTIGVAELVGFWRHGLWGLALEHRWTKRVGVALAVALLAVWLARFEGALGGPVVGEVSTGAVDGDAVTIPRRDNADVCSPLSSRRSPAPHRSPPRPRPSRGRA